MTAAIFTLPLDVLKARRQSDFYQSQLAPSHAFRRLPPLEAFSFQRSSVNGGQEAAGVYLLVAAATAGVAVSSTADPI